MQTAYPRNPAVAAHPPKEFRVPDTEQELQDFVAERLAYLRKNRNCVPHPSSKGRPDDNDSPLQSHCNTPRPNSEDYCHPTSSTCDKKDVKRLCCAVVEHCTTTTTAAATTKALEEYNSKASEANVKLTPRSKEKSKASKRILTEYPQIINEAAAAAATCTETESPVVLTAASGVWTCDELTEKYQPAGLTLSCSKQSKPVSVNADKDADRVPADAAAHKDRGGDKGLKPVDDVDGTITGPKDSWTTRVITADQDANIHKQKTTGNQQHCPVSSKKATAHSSVDRIQGAVTANQNKQPVYDQTSCKSIGKDVSYVCSQIIPESTQVALPLSGRVDRDTPSVSVLKEPQYEDISDAEEMSELDHNLEDPEYEDISEDENPPIHNMDVEMPSFLFDESRVKLHGQVQIKSILDEKLIPVKQLTPETDDDDDSECVSGAVCDHAECRRADCSSCSPSSDLKDEDETDDEMDDGWDIIPLIIMDISTGSASEDEADPVDVLPDDCERVDIHRMDVRVDNVAALCELHQPPPVQVPASTFSQIEVFDTRESFQQAKAVQFGKFPQNHRSGESLPERGLELGSHHSRRDSCSGSEDSCETDDSCNYSPVVEDRNHLTVSMKLLLNRRRNSSQSFVSDEESENDDDDDDEATNLQNSPTRSRQKGADKKKEDIILISDTEDECDQVCARRQKRRAFTENEVSAAAPCSSQKRHSSETVTSETVNPNLLRRELHDVARQNVSDDESIIVIDSDKEDDSIQNYKAKRKFSSEWAGTDDKDPFVKQQRTPVHTEYETPKVKLEQCRQSADSSKKCRTHADTKMQDTCSDLSHIGSKRGQLPEAKTGSVCVQQKTNTQMNASKSFHESDHLMTADKIVKKNAKTKRRMLSSEAGDSDSDFINVQKSPSVVNNSLSISLQSSKDSSEKQPQPGTDGEADTTVGCNPLIPRLLIQTFPQGNGPLKLAEFQWHPEETGQKKCALASKNLDSCKTKTQLLRGHTQGKFGEMHVSNPKPAAADERHLSNQSFSPTHRKRSPFFKLQRPDSLNVSMSLHSYTPTKGSSAMTQVTNKWRESYYSTRRDKKISVVMEEGSRPKNNHDLLKEAKPGSSHCDRAPRRRNSSLQESATPLMKRTRVEARELTKARNRDASWEQPGHRVGEGYKWNK